MRRFFLLAATIMSLCSISVFAQSGTNRPKLVVGIVVDQMRWDYLYRYSNRYGEGGFKRLLNEGYSCNNTMINYIPTVTAIGHTSIYTGSVPSIHGIAGNDFYKDGKKTYCTDDNTVQTIGSDSKAGQMSPRNLRVTTIGDELHLATNFRSKVIAVSLKDRASILPGGHTADGAYWFDSKTGNFITSSYYRKDLPSWLAKFNKLGLAEKYLQKDWNTLYPIDTYKESTSDNNDFEKPFPGMDKPIFPVKTSELAKTEGLGLIRNTPYGNSITLDLAKAAIDGEQLGMRGETDMLAVSLSSTDYVGHQFGINAIETEDTYLRLDRDLAEFFNALDSKLGKGNYIVFLTADHGGAHNFTFMQSHNMPAGGWNITTEKNSLNAMLRKKFGIDKDLVSTVMNYQVFLDNQAIAESKADRNEVVDAIIEELKTRPQVAYVVDQEKASVASIPEPIKQRLINGYCKGRSGEIQVAMQPGYYYVKSDDGTRGTDHGVWNPYDAHVPLLFMGWNIKAGATFAETDFTDIAPTICAMLRIQMPDGCVGKPIPGVVE